MLAFDLGMTGHLIEARQRADQEPAVALFDLAQRQARNVNDDGGGVNARLAQLQQIGAAGEIARPYPRALRQRIGDIRGAVIFERNRAHSPATSAIAATMFG